MKRMPKADTKTCYKNTQPYKGELFLETKMYEVTAIPPESPNVCNETIEQKKQAKFNATRISTFRAEYLL